mmetsp:Transcript_15640/g.25681  ORF Transcript_15640/g.25681 Transcript_15640/m.25681 type:complete len:285 (+) Transcript_15640:1819-2673(+)
MKTDSCIRGMKPTQSQKKYCYCCTRRDMSNLLKFPLVCKITRRFVKFLHSLLVYFFVLVGLQLQIDTDTFRVCRQEMISEHGRSKLGRKSLGSTIAHFQFRITIQKKIDPILSVHICPALEKKRKRRYNIVCGNRISFVGNTNMTQVTLLLKILEFLVVIFITDNWRGKCQSCDLFRQVLDRLIILSFQLCSFEGKQVCQATAETMPRHVKVKVLTSYVRVALELFIYTCNDAVKTLASILTTLLLIHQVRSETLVCSWLATGDENIIFTLEQRFMIESEVSVR